MVYIILLIINLAVIFIFICRKLEVGGTPSSESLQHLSVQLELLVVVLKKTLCFDILLFTKSAFWYNIVFYVVND